jgi:uncharacterized membrane protein
MKKFQLSNVILTTISLIAAGVFTVLMFKITLPYLSFKIDAGFLATKQSIIHIAHWRYAFYIHVCTSIFLLLFGAVQFVRNSAYRFRIAHRISGILYVVIIVLLSGPSGFVMGIYANGGMWAKISFVLLSVCWVYTTVLSYLKIKNGNVLAHKQYMIRSYALTLSAVTLRTYALVLPMFIHLHGRDEYVLIAWLSWVPNLILAEVFIRVFATANRK